MGYELTDEQRAAREEVTFTAGDGFDFGGGHYLENWRRSDKELDYAEIYVLVHGGFKFREVFRHRLPLVVDLDAQTREGKDPLPARRMLTSRSLKCQESLKWSKHLVIKKSMMGEPTCPIERLIEYVKANPKLIDEELFRFGDDCTTRDGKPENAISLNGYDLFNKAENWRNDHNFLAKGQHVGVVVPLGGVKGTVKWATADEDFASKIMFGSWGMFGKLEAEINDAIEQYGEDNADPRWAPAVYRLIFDQRPRGGKKPQPSDQYNVKFADRYIVPEAALAVGGSDIVQDVRSELDKIQTPATTSDLLEFLQAGLVYDLPLAEIIGHDPSKDEGGSDPDVFAKQKAQRDEERAASSSAAKAPATKKPAASKTPAPKANGKKKVGSRRVVVAPPADEPAPAPEVECSPCDNCGTPWPADKKYCPGRRGPKKCTAQDLDLPEPDDDVPPLAVDESTEIAFADE